MGKSKKKSGMLKPLILIVVSALLVVCFFLPVVTQKATLIGSEVSKVSVSGAQSVTALFSDKTIDLEASEGVQLGLLLKSSDATGGAMKTAAVCLLVTVILAGLLLLGSLYALFTRKKIPLCKLFALALLALSIVALICAIVVASKAGGLNAGALGSVNYTLSIGTILAAIVSLIGAAASFGLKK